MPDHNSMEWSVSELKLEDMDVIIKYLTVPTSELNVLRNISKSESLSMQTGVVDEISDSFEKLLPLQKFLTSNNNGGGNSRNSGNSIDEKFEAWLERNARKAGMKVEDYAKSNGLMSEVEDRHKRFKELREVLVEEPIDQTKIFPALKKSNPGKSDSGTFEGIS